MKRRDFFCISPASTAVCSSLDHRSMVRHGTRPLHRQNSKSFTPCSSSQLPINPKPYSYQKSRNSTSSVKEVVDFSNYRSSRKYFDPSPVKPSRKSSAHITDHVRTASPSGSSSRNLLSDRPYIDWISESDTDHVSALVPSQIVHPKSSKQIYRSSNDYSPARRSSAMTVSTAGSWTSESEHATAAAMVPSKTVRKSRHVHFSAENSPALKSSSSARSRDQVVVLRVSIHCKGCEGKVRKHLSKMEGVTSFSIDLATKKVTIIGNVTPLGVLASMSKVKNAQLWPSPTSSSPSPSPSWST